VREQGAEPVGDAWEVFFIDATIDQSPLGATRDADVAGLRSVGVASLRIW